MQHYRQKTALFLRFLLSKKSEYFRTMFFFSPNSKEFPLPSIESHILEQILVFLYTDEISIKIEHVADLLIACDFLLLDNLFRATCSFGMENIDVRNSLPLLNAAWILDKQILFQHFYRFVQLNFHDVVKISFFKIGCLSLDVLKMLLAEKCLNISSENIIWYAICTWIEDDLPARLRFVPDMLNHLNLVNMDESLAENIIRHPIVNKNEHCITINELRADLTTHCILDCHMYLQSYPVFPRERERIPSSINLYVSNKKLFITFDEKFNACQKISDLYVCPSDSIILDHKIHLFDDNNEHVFSWDLINNARTSISPIFYSRFSQLRCIVEVSNGIVYCLEFIDFNVLRMEHNYKVHRYIPDIDEWNIVAPPQPSMLPIFISFCNKLYIFGNTFPGGPEFRKEPLREFVAQTYNPETNTWSDISHPTRQSFCNIIQYQNKLLCFGNQNLLVQEYHPETNLWSTHSKLPFLYNHRRIQKISNILYIHEDSHFSFNENSVASPVFWDEECQNWKIVQDSFPFYKFKELVFFPINNREIVKRIILNRRYSDQKWMQNFFWMKIPDRNSNECIPWGDFYSD